MKYYGLVALLGLALVGCSNGGGNAPQGDTQYTCINDEGKSTSMVLQRFNDDLEKIALVSQGKSETYTRIEAASGEKYVDSTGIINFWLKGDEAMFDVFGNTAMTCTAVN